MNPFELVLVAVALGFDACAVGLGLGSRCCSPRQVFRLSFHFGLFQFLMPLVGWQLGRYSLLLIQRWALWLAVGLLVFIGGRMIVEALRHSPSKAVQADPTRGLSLVGLSLATSIDALGVGFSFGLMGRDLLTAAVVIGLTAAAMTWAAMRAGRRLSAALGRPMEVLGGLILLAIAVKLLI